MNNSYFSDFINLVKKSTSGLNSPINLVVSNTKNIPINYLHNPKIATLYKPKKKNISNIAFVDYPYNEIDELLKFTGKPLYVSFLLNNENINDTYKVVNIIKRTLRNSGYGVIYAEPLGRHHKYNFLPVSPLYSPCFVMIFKFAYDKKYTPSYRMHRRAGRVLLRFTHRFQDYLLSNKLVVNSIEYILKNLYLKRIKVFNNRYLDNLETFNPVDIIIIMTWLEFGGVERMMLNLIKGLKSRKYKVVLLTTTKSTNPWHNEFSKYCKDIIHLPDIIDYEYHYYYDEYIASYTEKSSAKALITTNSMPGYGAMKILGKKGLSINTIDILHTHGTPKDNDAFLKKSMPYKKYIKKRVVISEYLKDYYVRNYKVNSDDISVVYNGLSEQQLLHKPNTKNGRTIIGKTKSEVAITYIGRLEPDKSPVRLVEIAKKISSIDELKKVKFFVCGPGSLDAKMKNLIVEYGLKNIVMVGPVNHPLDVYAASEFSILTSNSEGIPMSVLESMQSGAVSILPKVGGIPEMIDDSSGYLIDIKGMEEEEIITAYANTIKKAVLELKENRSSMQINAKSTLDKKFNQMTERYLEIINS